MSSEADAPAVAQRRSSTHLRIVALAPNDWSGVWMNRQHLLSRLARHHSIVYSTGAPFTWERREARFRDAGWISRVECRDGLRVDRAGRLLVRTERIPAWDDLVRRRTARRWRRALGAADGPLVAYVFHPDYAPYAQALGADRLVYHAYDRYLGMAGATDALRRAEQWLLERADLVVASSEETALDFRMRGAVDVRVLPNAVNWSAYASFAARREECEALRGIPRPRIGYVGGLNRKVDFALLVALARREPRWHFVLAGQVAPLSPEDARLLHELSALPNVHRLGLVPQSSLPALLSGLDVGLICYKRSGWALACDPLKLYEYFAAGLPVVSADIRAVRAHATELALATGVDDWVAAIDAALRGHGPGSAEGRRATARANDWDVRAAQLDALLATLADRALRAAPGAPSSWSTCAPPDDDGEDLTPGVRRA